MKYLTLFIATLMGCNAYAISHSPCELEQYFRQTDSYKSSMLDHSAKELEMEREKLALLPDISVSSGQQSSNNRSFKGLSESFVSLSFSQSIYNGNRYNKFKDKIAKDKEYIDLMIHDKRNRYLVDLYRAVIDYNYKTDLNELYSLQLRQQTEQLNASKERLSAGEIAKIEYDIISLRKEELQKELKTIKNEVLQAELDIKARFNVPDDKIKNITSEKILLCKNHGQGTGQILDQSRILLKQNENANYQLKMASTQPSVSLSLNLQPPYGGTLNELTTKKTEFAAAINVTAPLSSIFSFNNTRKDHAISINRIDDAYDEKVKLYIREKENILNKMIDLERSISLSTKKIELKGQEVDFVLSRFREKKDTIMTYYRQLDEYEHEKIKLKQAEREYDYYKTYIAILN